MQVMSSVLAIKMIITLELRVLCKSHDLWVPNIVLRDVDGTSVTAAFSPWVESSVSNEDPRQVKLTHTKPDRVHKKPFTSDPNQIQFARATCSYMQPASHFGRR
jgi:hypothetical protein